MRKYDVEYKAVEDASGIKFTVIYEVDAENAEDAYEAAEDLLWASFVLAEYSFEFMEAVERIA